MKQKRKILSLILAGVMVFGTVPFTSVVANAEDTVVKKIELGTRGVSDKDFVYFGNYNSENIKWKVLDADKDNTGAVNGMLLLSEYVLEKNNVTFDKDNTPNDGQTYQNKWQHSDAQAWCKEFAESGAFTNSEKSALKGVTKSDEETTKYGFDWAESELKAATDTVFYLSAEEAANYIGPNNKDEGLLTTTSDDPLKVGGCGRPATIILTVRASCSRMAMSVVTL